MAKLEGVKTLDMVNGEITKVAYGGAEYERMEGEAQKGDIALVKEAWGNQNVAEFFVVTHTISDVDSRRQVVIVNGNVCSASAFRESLELFRKVADATNSSVEERVAKAEGEIESLKSDVAALKGEAEYKRIGKSEAQAGDYVKFIEADDEDITIGNLYEIEAIDCDGDPVFSDDIGQENYATSDDTYEVYRKVSAASVEAEPKPDRLQVGDYAKVVKNVRVHEVEVGKILLVTAIDDEAPFIKCDELSGNRIGWFFGHELVRATDEEVAEAKRAAAEHKKWAQIGREVGEYKEGDVVAYVDGRWFMNRGIGEVVGFGPEGGPSIEAVNSRGLKTSYYLEHTQLNLITPVEARFDS
ncbi:hypothetical protein [Bacillus halotolerans]|uniref:hypothetical protein n=1 Tax=Bacillus halotolerans TaxID=260554 RepID=UPI002DB672F4|nr:hypothetical protein [Bacillus halotolerans]MEC1648215.1 hypothetical protein [Bacillus halotolerans]